MARGSRLSYHTAMVQPSQTRVRKIVSGGQTGVDQGALSAAIWLGLEHGGWCPKGRRSEAGPIPAEFQLRESDSFIYSVRTEQNVKDSDGTLLLYRTKMSGGTAYTRRMAEKNSKPFFAEDLNQPANLDGIHEWIEEHEIQVLNVAGPRASSHRGIADAARQLLVQLLGIEN